jgi:PAS domain S-box-containing protein
MRTFLSSDCNIILNSIVEGAIAGGADRKLYFLNKAGQEILGYSLEEIVDQPCNTLCVGLECDRGCPLLLAGRSGRATNFEMKFRTKDGKIIPVSVNLGVMRDSDGNAIGGVGIFRDVSIIKDISKDLGLDFTLKQLIGKSKAMADLRQLILEVAPTNVSVLIKGESGTGKELVANIIHYNSLRRDKILIKVNCAALSENLLESELFGHVKGAFTGALSDRKGRFELSDGGTIFLDEIGELTPKLQVKLLRVLQEGEFERVGSSKTLKVNVRIIAATNRNLDEMIKSNRFRLDLYYRLNVFPINIPSLRERKEDIPLLISYSISKLRSEMGKDITGVSKEAMDFLMDYDYPGNIRELENILEHAFVRCHGQTILPSHLPFDDTCVIAKNLLKDIRKNSGSTIETLEKELILNAIKQTNYHLNKASRVLGIGRATLWRKMKKYGIEL